jgi:hypothetical protein
MRELSAPPRRRVPHAARRPVRLDPKASGAALDLADQ